jgi:hypothetical protein
MPGGPNRPPEVEAAKEAPAPAAATAPDRRTLRRLVPMRVALRLDLWKNGPSAELLTPLAGAEEAFRAGDFSTADGFLDSLAIRLAEPRWPTLPEPFRSLRVPIPTPQPPHWDPEHALSAADKEARQARRVAERQVRLARASLEAEARRGTSVDDLRPLLSEAEGALGPDASSPSEAFYAALDRIWASLCERVPMPTSAAAARAPPPVVAAAETGAGQA